MPLWGCWLSALCLESLDRRLPSPTNSPTNTATPTPTPTSTPGLKLTLMLESDPVSGTTVKSGQVVTYFLTLTGSDAPPALARGACIQANVTVTALIPANSTYIANSAVPLPVAINANNLVWDVPCFGSGSTFNATYKVTVGGAATTVVNRASASAPGQPTIESLVLTHPLAPAAVQLAGFSATRASGSAGSVVRWFALSEVGAVSYRVYRSDGITHGAELPENAVFIGVQSAQGAGNYVLADASAQAGARYTYWLVEINDAGEKNLVDSTAFGPLTIYLPLVAD